MRAFETPSPLPSISAVPQLCYLPYTLSIALPPPAHGVVFHSGNIRKARGSQALGSGATISSVFPLRKLSIFRVPVTFLPPTLPRTLSALARQMPFFSSPTSLRNNVLLSAPPSLSLHHYQMAHAVSSLSNDTITPFGLSTMSSLKQAPHSNHPALGNLILLVFEAVLEVVCVSLPGYIIARGGMFDADMQKFVANLNVSLFTPCLSKLLTFFLLVPEFRS